MNIVLDWAKANIFIIVFAVVMIAALVALPLLAGGMNAKVRDEVHKRAARLNEFSQLEGTRIRMPGDEESRPGVVNQRLLDRYRENIETARQDAEQVFEVALERNRQGRTVAMADMFPSMPPGMRDVYPERFHRRLMQQYEDLLAELRVGGPPDPESVREEIRQREQQFFGQVLAREIGERLTEEEQERLREQLAELRLLRYQDAAERFTYYLPREILNLPRWSQQNIPNLAELFERQWRFWIHSDVLRALAAANRNEPSLLTAPVKRVLRFDFAGVPAAAPGSGGRASGGGGAVAGGGGGIVAGGGGAAAPGSGRDPGAAEYDPTKPLGPVTINNRAEAPRDFAVSFTGRKTNSLYDVRYVELELIVETSRIPELLDALARQNVMTVTNLRMSPADPYEDARDGYFYGLESVSRLTLLVETIWFRSWTAQYMPAATRAALGVASAPATPDS